MGLGAWVKALVAGGPEVVEGMDEGHLFCMCSNKVSLCGAVLAQPGSAADGGPDGSGCPGCYAMGACPRCSCKIDSDECCEKCHFAGCCDREFSDENRT